MKPKIRAKTTDYSQFQADMVENFLSATLDARLVAAEVDLQEEVDNIPLPILDSVLAKYLGVTEDKIVREKDVIRKDVDPDSVCLKSNGTSEHESGETARVKREAVTAEEESKLFEELPFVEVNQGLCIKLEPP